MKKLLLIFVAFATALTMNAQPGGQGMPPQRMTAEQMAQRNLEQMQKVITLSEQQAKDIYNHYLEQAKEMEKMFAEGMRPQGSREDFMNRMKAQEEKIKKIIGEENYKIWQEKRPQRRGPGGQGGPGQRPNR